MTPNARKKLRNANKKALKDHDEAAAKADKDARDAHVKYLEDKANAEHLHQAAEAIPDSRAGLETYIKDKTEAADVRTEKARHDALAIGNEKYSGVNKALNSIDSDMEKMTNGLDAAMEKIKGSDTEPPIIKDFAKKVQQGEVLSYEDLQGYYSELNRELNKGTLLGDVYAAYDTLRDVIGDDMQRIADSQGMGAELKDARNYWRRMKQTFGQSSDAINNRAGKAVASANPDYADDQAADFRNRLLASFDPEIPKLLDSASKARERLGKMPSEEAARKMKADNPIPRQPEAPQVAPPATKPVPKARTPLEFKPKTLGPEDVRAAKDAGMQSRADYIGNKAGVAAGTYLIYRLLGALTHHEFADIPSAIEGGVLGYAGLKTVSKLFENPSIREFATKATAQDLAQIPPEMRSQLAPFAEEAKKQGIKVSPALISLTASAGAGLPSNHPLASPPQ